MRAAELREMDESELLTHLTEAKQELFNLRFQHVTGQLDNYRRLGQVRRDIARINTVLRERDLAMIEPAPVPRAAARGAPEVEAEAEPEETDDVG